MTFSRCTFIFGNLSYVDRSLVGDIGRLGGNVLGIRSYGDNSIDHYGGGAPRSVEQAKQPAN